MHTTTRTFPPIGAVSPIRRQLTSTEIALLSDAECTEQTRARADDATVGPTRMSAIVITTEDLLSSANLADASADLLGHLVMDTPEDQALNTQVVQTQRSIANALRHVAKGPAARSDLEDPSPATLALAQALATVDGQWRIFTSMTKSEASARDAASYVARAEQITRALAAIGAAPQPTDV